MRNYLRSSVAGLALGLMTTAGAIAPAFAQPQFTPPRQFTSQQQHYIRVSLATNMCTQVAGTCSFKVQAAVPYNSIITRVTRAVGTAFNSVTSDVLFLGTVKSSGNIVGVGCDISVIGQSDCTIATAGSAGINAIGNGAVQTGTNGGFDLWVTWTSVGTAATTGNGALLIFYVAPNDGDCTAVTMGATAPGC